jgi:hypothetical protein
MVPALDLDHHNISPEVLRCLRDILPYYIRNYKLHKPGEQEGDVLQATFKLLFCFDFNSDHKYDSKKYFDALAVCISFT